MEINIGFFDLDFSNVDFLINKVEYCIEIHEKIELNCRFELVPNTAYSLNLLKIFNLLEDYKKQDSQKVSVNFFYKKDNLDMVEWIEEFREENIILPINYVIE